MKYIKKMSEKLSRNHHNEPKLILDLIVYVQLFFIEIHTM